MDIYNILGLQCQIRHEWFTDLLWKMKLLRWPYVTRTKSIVDIRFKLLFVCSIWRKNTFAKFTRYLNLAVFRRPLKIQKCFTWFSIMPFYIWNNNHFLGKMELNVYRMSGNIYMTYPFKWTYLSFHIHLCVVVHLSEDNSCKSLVQNLNCKQIRIIENSASYH